jgi:hypothetical protein
MFQVSLINLVIAYLIGSLLVLGLAWFIGTGLRRRRDRRNRHYQVFCTYCGLIYEDHGKSDLTRCPKCTHLHERGRPSSL